jgi:hypothetical protein
MSTGVDLRLTIAKLRWRSALIDCEVLRRVSRQRRCGTVVAESGANGALRCRSPWWGCCGAASRGSTSAGRVEGAAWRCCTGGGKAEGAMRGGARLPTPEASRASLPYTRRLNSRLWEYIHISTKPKGWKQHYGGAKKIERKWSEYIAARGQVCVAVSSLRLAANKMYQITNEERRWGADRHESRSKSVRDYIP